MDCAAQGCHGAWPRSLYNYLMTSDIPHESCSPYRAIDEDCTAINTCKTCSSDETCSPIPSSSYWGFGVQDHGSITGRQMIQLEILTSGPVVCVIAATPEFRAYAGGIFNDTVGGRPNHALMVGGWGTEDGIDYWIVRNRSSCSPLL